MHALANASSSYERMEHIGRSIGLDAFTLLLLSAKNTLTWALALSLALAGLPAATIDTWSYGMLGEEVAPPWDMLMALALRADRGRSACFAGTLER
jgi:hypothetical protein